MKRKYFGTDGIRGRANGLITPELALKVGMAAGLVFQRGDHRHRVLIGKDTRLSGYMIENALTAGFTSVGMDVLLTGPLPTPGVATLTRSMRADLGVMISASHNAFDDNGIKLFGPDGYKLSDEIELEIEKLIDSDLSRRLAGSEEIGRARRIDGVQDRYIEYAKRTLPRNLSLEGLRVVVDCANGAAYRSRRKACGSWAPKCFPSGLIRTASTSIANAAPPRRTRWLRKSAKCGRISALHWMAMPTASCLWTKKAIWSMATSCSRSSLKASARMAA
jgi:phosphoglucosamine mutase